MDEKLTKLQWKKMVRLVLVIGAILMITTMILIIALVDTINDSTENQMYVETEEYKNRIYKQIDGDFQSLNTLASFFSSDMLKNQEVLAAQLDASNEQNNFMTMAFFFPDGKGIVSTLGKEIRSNISYKKLNEATYSVIEKALQGEKSVSKLFRSDAIDGKVFVYAVPVYVDQKLVGALMASDQIEIFSDILGGDEVLGGHGYIHMIGSEGDFLIRSSNTIVKEKLENIFDGPYFNNKQISMIKGKMKEGKESYSFFQYENKRYRVLLEPVGINGWYLMCVNTLQGDNQYAYQILKIMGFAFGGTLVIIVFLLVYGFRLVQKNNRELRYQACHDPLTGAKNLLCFHRELSEVLEKNLEISVVALDIHQFKFINEIFGRDYGDRLLVEISEVLHQKIEKGEFFARDNADLFYLCFFGTEKSQIVSRLQEIMNEIVNISNHRHNNYRILLYCGVAVNTEKSTQEASVIMTHVKFALTKAKGSFQNNIWFYDSQLHEREKTENYVESHMHQALQDGEFQLYLQPKIELKTGQLKGAEALVRWVRKDGSMIYPDEFIPLFEQNGFCTQLDVYMVECACRQIREWMDRGIKPIGISVNQSKLLFYEKDYIDTITTLIKKYDIPDQFITLEILEGLAAENVEELNDKIKSLQKQGICVSLDDFGSGYSSLNVLGNLHIDELKLDRGFLMEVTKEKNIRLRMIMEEIVQLTKRLEIATVVEGVETAENEKLCQEIGCDLGQGYYYSRPLERKKFNQIFMNMEEKP